MEQFEEKADQLEIKCSQLESKLKKMESALAKKDKDNQKLQETIEDLKAQISEKEQTIEKMPKHSEDQIRKQIDITNVKIQENFSLKNVIDQQKSEFDKMKKKFEAAQDLQINKQTEMDQLQKEYKAL